MNDWESPGGKKIGEGEKREEVVQQSSPHTEGRERKSQIFSNMKYKQR